MKGVLFGAAASLMITAPALAQDGLGFFESNYVQAGLGASVGGESDADFEVGGLGSGYLKTDLDAGLAAYALIGRSYTSGVAFELEGLFVDNDVDTDGLEVDLQRKVGIRTTTYGAFANVKYEYVNPTPLFPYVGAGVGYGSTDYKILGSDGGSDGVLWQVKAGVAIPTSSDVTLDLGYRYMRSPDYERTSQVQIGGQTYDARFKAATDIHALAAGLRWAF